MSTFVPLIVAVISATTLLFGYIYQKHKERQFEINRTRQEIYTRLVRNLSEKLELFERLQDDPDMPEKATAENVEEVMKLIAKKYPELDKNFNEGREIMSLMALYATDDAIQACAQFYRESYASMQPGSEVRPDKNELILRLRKSIFPKTKVASEDIKFITSK
jgi:hypothetical protein